MNATIVAFQLGLTSVTNLMTLSTKRIKGLNGVVTAKQFVDELENDLAFSILDAPQMLNFAKATLHGQAKDWYRIVGRMTVPTYEAFKEEVLRVFPEVVDRVAFEEELFTVRQRQNQAAAPLVIRKINVIIKLRVHENTAERALAIIVSRMLPELKDFLQLNPPTNIITSHEPAVLDDLRYPPNAAFESQRRPFVPQISIHLAF